MFGGDFESLCFLSLLHVAMNPVNVIDYVLTALFVMGDWIKWTESEKISGGGRKENLRSSTSQLNDTMYKKNKLATGALKARRPSSKTNCLTISRRKRRQTWFKATNLHEPGIIWVAGVLTNKPGGNCWDEATHQCSQEAAEAWGRCRGRRAAAPGSTQRDRSSPDVPQSAGWHYWTRSGTRSALLRGTEGQEDAV